MQYVCTHVLCIYVYLFILCLGICVLVGKAKLLVKRIGVARVTVTLLTQTLI
jgi:hypothetical protein